LKHRIEMNTFIVKTKIAQRRLNVQETECNFSIKHGKRLKTTLNNHLLGKLSFRTSKNDKKDESEDSQSDKEVDTYRNLVGENINSRASSSFEGNQNEGGVLERILAAKIENNSDNRNKRKSVKQILDQYKHL